MYHTQNLILSDLQTLQKIRRIAYQIYENNFDEKAIVLAGITPNGTQLTNLLQEELQKITDIPISSTSLQKQEPTNLDTIPSYRLACAPQNIENKVVIVVDDVLHTGKTLIYALHPLLNIPVKKIQTVVLVKRAYQQFPIHADYVGYALSTTILQHVHVELLKKSELGVYLF
jgi:pyrimidine operon attenuation protein/uracil phosphoribosyltransferase